MGRKFYIHFFFELTFPDKAGVADPVDDGLGGDNPSDITMEDVESTEIPTGEPEEDIIPTSKKPEKGHICYGEESGPICDVRPRLLLVVRPTIFYFESFN